MTTPTGEFSRRLELVRRITHLNSGRTTFSREEELQFVTAVTLFTTAELLGMLESGQTTAAAAALQEPAPKSRPSTA